MTPRVPETGDVAAYTAQGLLARQPGTPSDGHVAGASVRPTSLSVFLRLSSVKMTYLDTLQNTASQNNNQGSKSEQFLPSTPAVTKQRHVSTSSNSDSRPTHR